MLPAVLALALSTPTHAQDAVTMEAVRFGQVGVATPGMSFHVHQDADNLRLRVDCGGKVQERHGPARAGETIDLRFEVPVGSYTCTGSLSGEFADGTTGEAPIRFGIQMLPPMKITLLPEGLSLAERHVALTLDRKASKVEVVALGAKGAELAQGLLPTEAAPGTRIDAEWGAPSGEPIKLRIRAFDEHGFYSELLVSVWSYAIPHEDVVFETGQAVVRPAEEGKLEAAWARVQEVTARYGKVAPVNLYVAGYTDTVGAAASNLALSEARAKAIARWFQARGFAGSIHYQGLGEQGLAVPTPDEFDEERNRRADYLVAAQAPPTSERLPAARWTPLR